MMLDVAGDEAPALQDITDWFNTDDEDGLEPGEPDSPAVLLDFWSHSSLDGLHHLSYVKQLWSHYRDHGLTVIGVHTPRFTFEQDPEHVETAVTRHGIDYPVALDADNTTWTLYGNRHRPRQTLINGEGRICYEQVGTGERYTGLEQQIRRLLLRAGSDLPDTVLAESDREPVQDIENELVSPRIDAGAGGPDPGNAAYQVCAPYARIDYEDRRTSQHTMNRLYLSGTWTRDTEYAVFQGDSGYASLRFTARDCAVTLGCRNQTGLRVAVEMDGEPVPDEKQGQDLQEDGTGTYLDVSRPRMYRLVSGDAVEIQEIRLIPRDTGLQLYTFSFL